VLFLHHAHHWFCCFTEQIYVVVVVMLAIVTGQFWVSLLVWSWCALATNNKLLLVYIVCVLCVPCCLFIIFALFFVKHSVFKHSDFKYQNIKSVSQKLLTAPLTVSCDLVRAHSTHYMRAQSFIAYNFNNFPVPVSHSRRLGLDPLE